VKVDELVGSRYEAALSFFAAGEGSLEYEGIALRLDGRDVLEINAQTRVPIPEITEHSATLDLDRGVLFVEFLSEKDPRIAALIVGRRHREHLYHDYHTGQVDLAVREGGVIRWNAAIDPNR
jgi:hypothetical protein